MSRSSRLAISGMMIVLAPLFAMLSVLLYWEIGFPWTVQPPHIMQTTSVTLFGVTLVGWQMYFVDAALALFALLLAVGSIYLAVRAFVNPFRYGQPQSN
jgi:hypothetical protein